MRPKESKARTTVGNRIARMFGAQYSAEGPYNIETDSMVILVETSATVRGAVRRLAEHDGKAAYVAMTNKEGLPAALQATRRKNIGVMDPQGEIVKPAPPE